MKRIQILSSFAILFGLALMQATGQTPATPAKPSPTTSPAPTEKGPLFPSTPPLDISASHDFPDAGSLNDEAAPQLQGLCSLADFRALPQEDRYVYSFDPWPSSEDDLQKTTYCFNFRLSKQGVADQKVAFLPNGGFPGGSHNLTRAVDPTSSKRVLLKNFGALNWGAKAEHVFKFDKPVRAFGVVLRSSGDVDVRRFLWKGNKERNGYPLTYTLSDGTVVNLGERELRGTLLKANTDAFLGVIDRTGLGITSISYMLIGLAEKKDQSICMMNMAFATMPKPAVAPVINLKGSCDFDSPDTIAAKPAQAVEGLASLDAFRFIVGNHRYVYHFDTWPKNTPSLGSNTGEFAFDLNDKGTVGQKVAISITKSAKDAKLTQTTLENEGATRRVLAGLGDMGNGAWAEQTFKFEKPVWAFGITYRSPNDLHLKSGAAKDYPVSYTLSDGKTVNLGAPGSSAGVVAGKGKTFVGVIDDTDKGITSITLRVQGTAKDAQSLWIEDIGFALAGPPPGDWKLTLEDNFDGDKLNPDYWTTGYRWPDIINHELQAFVPENVTVANGLCTIKTEKRDCFNIDRLGRKGPAQKFASGAFTSYDKMTQTYGYFEARIKMPKARGAGVWPAFWMLPDRGREYPEQIRTAYRTKEYGLGCEIDIFEFMPRWKRTDGLFQIHIGCIWSYGKVTEQDPAPHGYGGYAKDNDGWGPQELYYPDADTKFHTYGLYWSPERLIFYLDSKPIFRVRDPKHVPEVPHYFMFNIALHTNGWGRSPDKTNPTMEQIIEDMPNQMEIDYFRAYSGTLEEPIPTSPTDIPVVRKFSPPPKDAPSPTPTPTTASTPAPSTTATPATSGSGVSSAPVNVGIDTPSN